MNKETKKFDLLMIIVLLILLFWWNYFIIQHRFLNLVWNLQQASVIFQVLMIYNDKTKLKFIKIDSIKSLNLYFFLQVR
jgi:hypothetical protein